MCSLLQALFPVSPLLCLFGIVRFLGICRPNALNECRVISESLVRIGPTPTERYDQLLEDIGALQLTNLGKKPNKTYSAAASHGDLDEVKLDHPPTSLNDDTPKIAEALSSKALKLHDDFADERLDAQKLLLQVQEKEEPLQDSARRLGISVGEASGRYNGSASSKPDKQEARPSVVLDEALVRALEQGRVDM